SNDPRQREPVDRRPGLDRLRGRREGEDEVALSPDAPVGQLASHALDQGLGDGEAEPLGIGPGGGEGELVGQSHLGPGRQPGPAIDHLTYVPTEAAAGPARRSIEGRSHAAVAVATASATQGTGSMFGNQWS